jgi:hypothetical protein
VDIQGPWFTAAWEQLRIQGVFLGVLGENGRAREESRKSSDNERDKVDHGCILKNES